MSQTNAFLNTFDVKFYLHRHHVKFGLVHELEAYVKTAYCYESQRMIVSTLKA